MNFIEGACVFLDRFNNSNIIFYKEIDFNKVFLVKYNKNFLRYGYVNLKDLDILVPNNCIHILDNLPYINDIDLVINVWKNLAIDKLNKQIKKN